MTVSELKLKIFRQIDALDESRLEELHGILINYMNGQNEVGDWEKLSDSQKEGIYHAIDEIDAGKGIPHEHVIAEIRKKYSNG